MPPLTAFITGLTTGGLTCLAVQGGLLIGLLAQRDGDDPRLRGWKRALLPVAVFLAVKIIAHTALGFGLGWLGNSIALTPEVRISLQIVAAVFMVVTGIRLFAPGFLPWLNITAPAPVRRFIRRRAKSTALVAPAVLGLLTILIPCGTTQAMEVAAIATSNPLQAASIMLAFTLGTAPLFLVIGVMAKGTTLLQSKLAYAAAAVVIGLGLYTFNGALISVDSPYSFQNIVASARVALSGSGGQSADAAFAETRPEIEVASNGYSPEEITVPAGRSVTLTLRGKGSLGCTSIFRIPKLNIETDVPQRGSTTIAANFPTPGRYLFTCGMGMYSGTINAI